MRKIEQRMVIAMKEKNERTEGPLKVRSYSWGSVASSYGSLIADLTTDFGLVGESHGLTIHPPSRLSVTTKSHMNAVLEGFGIPARIRTIKGVPHLVYDQGASVPFDSPIKFNVGNIPAMAN
jgi:hypothetical protein